MIEDADIVQVTRDPDDEPKSLLVPAAPCHRTPVSACGHDRRREDGAEQEGVEGVRGRTVRLVMVVPAIRQPFRPASTSPCPPADITTTTPTMGGQDAGQDAEPRQYPGRVAGTIGSGSVAGRQRPSRMRTIMPTRGRDHERRSSGVGADCCANSMSSRWASCGSIVSAKRASTGPRSAVPASASAMTWAT